MLGGRVHEKKYWCCLSFSIRFFPLAPAAGHHRSLGTSLPGSFLLLPSMLRAEVLTSREHTREKKVTMVFSDPEGRHNCVRASWTPSGSQIPVMKWVITRVRTRRLFRKHYSEFPGHSLDGKGRNMFLSVFEMSRELNWVADNSEEQ